MNRPGKSSMNDIFQSPSIEGVPCTVPINPDAKPYEPGYDWTAHGYDELDDNVKWVQIPADRHALSIINGMRLPVTSAYNSA